MYEHERKSFDENINVHYIRTSKQARIKHISLTHTHVYSQQKHIIWNRLFMRDFPVSLVNNFLIYLIMHKRYNNAWKHTVQKLFLLSLLLSVMMWSLKSLCVTERKVVTFKVYNIHTRAHTHFNPFNFFLCFFFFERK